MYCPQCYNNFSIQDLIEHTKNGTCDITIDRLLSAGVINRMDLHNFATVQSIQEIDFNDNVYDLEIEGNHNYFANGHLVHNCHELVLQGLFGPVKRVITTKELMDQDTLAQLEISMLAMQYNDDTRKIVSKMKYQDEISFIVSHERRNNFIANLALDQEGNTLVLFNLVEKHGKPLYEKIKSKLAKRSQRKIFFVSGETDVSIREEIRAITEKENDAIIVASLGTFSTGINIRNLHNIIFASPSKSQVKVLQSIGRGLRKSDDGRITKLYDIVDNLQWKSKKNYTLEHGAERMKIYTKEQFKFKVYEVKIEE